MAAISEKLLWPIVGIFIFGVLAAFYIDDRRRLAEQGALSSSGQQAATVEKSSSKVAEKNDYTHSRQSSTQEASRSSSEQSHQAASQSIEEYLAQSSQKRSAELEANVRLHQGFSGGIDEYLHGKPSMQANLDKSFSQKSSANTATSMSMQEYQAKSGDSSATQQTAETYYGGIDEYLKKYGDAAQTPVKKRGSDPFNKKEHMGFHGSYEEYAKKYN